MCYNLLSRVAVSEPEVRAEGTNAKLRMQKTTLGQIAKQAGVSLATVSRVVNGRNGVSIELRERVLRVASKFDVNLEERKNSRILAFLLSNRDVLHPFHSSILAGAEAYCAEQEYGLLFLSLHYLQTTPWQALHLHKILQRRELINGAIVSGTNSQNLLQFLTHAGIPFVILGNNLVSSPLEAQFNTVYFDDISGAYEMTRYLQSLGHLNICYVGNCRLPWYARRCKGYRHAMEEAGMPPHILDIDSACEEDMGYLAAKTVLQGKGGSVTAFCAGGDVTARGIYMALRDAGLCIPQDVSVTGFNDTLEAAVLHPPLTTVRVFTDLIGNRMAKLLLRHVRQPALEPETVTIPTQVVKRQSCRQLVIEPRRELGRERIAAPKPSEVDHIAGAMKADHS